MARDEVREAEAFEWVDGTFGHTTESVSDLSTR
jgi:hypothetical protein